MPAHNGSGDRAREGAGWLPLVSAAAVAWPVILGGENRGVSKADAAAGVKEPPGVKVRLVVAMFAMMMMLSLV
eukprot:17027-Eustigmatos_ZCMA.PRE.1